MCTLGCTSIKCAWQRTYIAFVALFVALCGKGNLSNGITCLVNRKGHDKVVLEPKFELRRAEVEPACEPRFGTIVGSLSRRCSEAQAIIDLGTH